MSRVSHYKIVLLGEGAVGKTSILTRYMENKFNDKHLSTLQASFTSRKLEVDGDVVTINIWDTAGQEKFRALGPIYYRDSHAALLVYDITDRQSFDQVKSWVRELRAMLGSEVTLFLVGNKTDLEEQRTVPQEDAVSYAADVSAHHRLISAKRNEGVEEVFLEIAKEVHRKTRSQATSVAATSQGDVIRLAPDEPTARSCSC